MRRLLQLAALALVLAVALAGQTATALPSNPPTWCGDPCSPNGAETGCACVGANGVWYRNINCVCVNGHWVG